MKNPFLTEWAPLLMLINIECLMMVNLFVIDDVYSLWQTLCRL